MSTKTTIIVFTAIFSLGVFLIVLLPFFLLRGPSSGIEEQGEPKAEAAFNQGVFRSDDGGRTWQPKSAVAGGGSLIAFRVNRLMAESGRPDTLYLLTNGGGLWVSRNSAESWRQVIDARGALEPNSNVLAMAVNPARGDEWFVAVFQKNRGRVLMTDDGGRTFSEIYFTPLDRFGVFDVYYDRSRSAVVIATGQGGLLETKDRGRTWRVQRWFADGLLRLLVNPARPGVRFLASSRGSLFRSRDSGETWVDISSALNEFSGAAQNQRWLMDQSGTLWLGSSHGLLRSNNDGASFEAPPLIIPPEAMPILAVAVDPQNAARILISAQNQLYESADSGQTWTILPSPGQGRITDIVIDPARPETIYAAVQP